MSKVRSKRKQIILKKANDLVEKCGLKVNLVFYDAAVNVLQEVNSCRDMSAEQISNYKSKN